MLGQLGWDKIDLIRALNHLATGHAFTILFVLCIICYSVLQYLIGVDEGRISYFSFSVIIVRFRSDMVMLISAILTSKKQATRTKLKYFENQHRYVENTVLE